MENRSKKLTKLEFFLKYKFYFVLTFASIFLFLSGVWEYSYIFSAIAIVLYYFFASKEEIICGTVFTFFFSGLRVFFMVCLGSAFLIFWVKYLIDVKKKQNIIHKVPLFLTIFILVVWGIVGLFYNDYGFSALEQGSLIICFSLFAYLMFACYKEISITKCLNFMMIGLAVSVALGLLSMVVPNYSIAIFCSDGEYDRLNLFTDHVNHISMLCLFLISFLIYQIINRRGRLLINLIFIALALGTGFFTLSKAFFIVCVGFAGYILIYLLKRFKLKSLRVIVPLVIVVAIVCLAFRGFVSDIFERFLTYKNETISIIGSITTGRSAIWQTYIDVFRSSIPRMLFGCGLFVNELVDIGPHNVYLYILNRFGIVGIILLCVLIYSYFKCSTVKLKPKYSNMLPFLTFFVLSLEEMILSERFGIFLIFAIMIMLENYDEREVPQNAEEYEKVTKILESNILKKE